MHDPAFISEFIKRAEELFLHPRHQYSWNEIIVGTYVNSPNGPSRNMAVLEKNTLRGFHKIDKCGIGAGEAFRDVMVSRKKEILSALESAQTQQELHAIQNDLRLAIRTKLTNIKPTMLISYNKVRKPLDLYFEHLIAMAKETSHLREKLVKMLFLPLDSQMFLQKAVFTENDLSNAGVSRRSTYTSVSQENSYLSLQAAAKRRADTLSQISGKNFAPIYFDLFWNDRYRRPGNNLFETNPY